MRLIDRILVALPDQVPVVIVGPGLVLDRPVEITREEPAGAGPAAAVVAGLGCVDTPIVVVCAVDQPFAGPLLAQLAHQLQGRPDDVEALIPVVDDRPQPLCAAYRSAALRRCAEGLGAAAGRSIRDLIADLAWVPAPDVPTDRLSDVDTREDLARARLRSGGMMDNEWEVRMQEWIAAVAAELGVTGEVPVDVVLDVARDAAHKVERPAAPVTTFMVGLAVAAGMSPDEAGARVHELASRWPASDE